MGQNHLFTLLFLVHTCLTFLLGVNGNELAELIRLPSELVIIAAIVLIILYTWLSLYLSSNLSMAIQPQSSQGRTTANAIPRTMGTIFPIGIVIGLCVAVIAPFMSSKQLVLITYPYYPASDLYMRLEIDWHEIIAEGVSFLGYVVGGILSGSRVAASLVVGHALGFATGLIVMQGRHAVGPTYAAHLGIAGVIAALLLVHQAGLRSIRKYVFEDRI